MMGCFLFVRGCLFGESTHFWDRKQAFLRLLQEHYSWSLGIWPTVSTKPNHFPLWLILWVILRMLRSLEQYFGVSSKDLCIGQQIGCTTSFPKWALVNVPTIRPSFFRAVFIFSTAAFMYKTPSPLATGLDEHNSSLKALRAWASD